MAYLLQYLNCICCEGCNKTQLQKNIYILLGSLHVLLPHAGADNLPYSEKVSFISTLKIHYRSPGGETK